MMHFRETAPAWISCALMVLMTGGCERFDGSSALADVAVSSIPIDSIEPPIQGSKRRQSAPRSAAHNEQLVLRRIFGDSLTFGGISGLQAVGNYLVVSDQLTDPHLSIVDLSTGRVTARLGKHGRGPHEFINPSAFSVVSQNPPRVWVYDFNNRRYSLLDGAGDWMIRTEHSLEVGASLLEPHRRGDRIWTNGLFNEYSILVMDTLGRPLRRIATTQPFTEREMPLRVGQRLMNRSYLAASPSNERLALVYQFANRIDIFQGHQLQHTIESHRQTTPRYRVENQRFFWEAGNEINYAGVAATDRYIYALFCGCKLEHDSPPSLLHIYRWDGSFVEELEFGRPVLRMAVSPDDRILYASFEDPHPVIGEWVLPQLPS